MVDSVTVSVSSKTLIIFVLFDLILYYTSKFNIKNVIKANSSHYGSNMSGTCILCFAFNNISAVLLVDMKLGSEFLAILFN